MNVRRGASAGAEGGGRRLRARRGPSGSDPLERHRDRPAATEAERGEPVTALAALQFVEEGGNDPGPGGPDRVAEGDRSPVDVHLRPVEAELTAIGKRLRGERLVDLDEVERLDREVDPLEQPADTDHRGEEQPLRLDLGLGIADDPGERPQAEPLDRPFAHDHRGGRPVRDAGRIAGSDRPLGRVAAILAGRQGERGPETLEGLEGRIAARVLVLRDDRLAALRIACRDRDEFIREPPRVHRRDRATMTLERERVLVAATDAVADRDPFGVCTHVTVLDRAPQAVADRRVDDRAIAEPVAEPGVRQQVGRQIHVLHAAGDRDLRVAGPDLGGGEHDRLEAGSADSVDRRRARRRREPCRKSGLPSRRLAGTRLEDLAHEDFVDRGSVRHAGPLDRRPDRDRPELGCGRPSETPRETADRRPDRTHEEHRPVHATHLGHVRESTRTLATGRRAHPDAKSAARPAGRGDGGATIAGVSTSDAARPGKAGVDPARMTRSARPIVGSISLDGALIVTDWDEGAERIYGIPRALAVGRAIDDLIDSASEGVAGGGPPDRSWIADGRTWLGRTVDRPRIGARAGETMIVETIGLPVLDTEGRIDRLTGIVRDVSPAVALENELPNLAILTAGSGARRSREEIATGAIEILCRATGAAAGAVAAIDGDHYVLLAASSGFPDIRDLLEATPTSRSALLRELAPLGRVIVTDPEAMPMQPRLASAFTAAGFRSVAMTALREHGDILGVVGLGWRDPDARTPSVGVIAQAAAQLSVALENRALLAEVDERIADERQLSARLEALSAIARLPQVGDEADLARSVIEQLMTALGALAGTVWRAIDEHWTPIAEVNLDPRLVTVRETYPASAFPALQRLRAGTVPYVAPFLADQGLEPAVQAAVAAHYGARAVFRVDDTPGRETILTIYFPGDPTEAGGRGAAILDERTLEAISRSVGVAFANHRLRAELEAAAETQRMLAAQYEAIFRDSPEPILMSDRGSQRIVELNEAAATLYGGSRADWVGRPATDLATVTDEERVRMSAALDAGRATFRLRGRRLDGSTFPAQVTAVRVTVGAAQRSIVQVRDLSVEERVQDELIQAQKMEAIGQLVAGVAHELNNPLAAIIGFSEVIRRDRRLPDDLHRDADILIQEAARTKRIVENLLDFARQRPPERHPTRLRLLIDAVLELQSYQLASDAIRTIVEIPDDLPSVPLDRSQLQQVILNLTYNAIQAIRGTGQPGTITIGASVVASPAGRTARITVADDGPGVPAELVARLFVPFFTTKEPGEGTGLGLSVSFGIVAAHGGRLSYEPRAGGGAIFVIEIPFGANVDEPARPGEPVTASTVGLVGDRATEGMDPAPIDDAGPIGASTTDTLTSRRILVVDDEPSIRAFIGRVLTAAGWEPVLVPDGRAAIALIESGEFAAILSDHRMAGMTGIDVYQAVADVRPDLVGRFILMSGDVLNPELTEFAAARGIHLLAKPFDIGRIRGALATVMAADRADAPQS